jgi:hypothetical protein
MVYLAWGEMHGQLATSMPVLVESGADQAHLVGVPAGSLTFLWGDAVADGLYEELHGGITYIGLQPTTAGAMLSRRG